MRRSTHHDNTVRSVCLRHHRARHPRVSRRAHRARSGRVGSLPLPRIAPRRRPRFVAVVHDSSRVVRRTCTDESRARASSPSRSSLESSPSAATEVRRGCVGEGDSLTGRDSSYTYQTNHRARESLESVRIARRDARVGDARERDESDVDLARRKRVVRGRPRAIPSLARRSRGRHRRRRSVGARQDDGSNDAR